MLGTQTHRGEGRLDRVGGAEVYPMLCRVVVERQQGIAIVAQAVHGLRVLGREALERAIAGPLGVLAALGPPDLVPFGLDLRRHGFR
jgi:hypothetical protein